MEQHPYDSGWPVTFEAARAELVPIFGNGATVDHIGSTSIPGIAAQPIIDILVQLPALPVNWDQRDALEALGYGEQLGTGGVNQVFYRAEPRTKIHVTVAGGQYASDRLLFRDYLRQHPERRHQYEVHKAELAACSSDDQAAYTAAKLHFVQQTIALAAAPSPAEPEANGQPA